jgi:hypothetical protein
MSKANDSPAKNNIFHAVEMERVDMIFIPQSLSRTTESLTAELFFSGVYVS